MRIERRHLLIAAEIVGRAVLSAVAVALVYAVWDVFTSAVYADPITRHTTTALCSLAATAALLGFWREGWQK